MEEIFKAIDGFDGAYQVSNTGVVRAIIYKGKQRTRILTQEITHHGYRRVALATKGTVKKYYVHRLVAEAFISKCQVGKMINHKDFNKQNNSVCNLEWVTHSENLRHYWKSHKYPDTGPRLYSAKLSSSAVSEIRKLKRNGASAIELSLKFEVAERTIRDVLARKTWRHVK